MDLFLKNEVWHRQNKERDVIRNRDVILNIAKYFYKNDKEWSRDNAIDKYRNLSEEEKNKKREYGRNRYHNKSEEKKQKLNEYRKNYCEANKSRKSWLNKKMHDYIFKKF